MKKLLQLTALFAIICIQGFSQPLSGSFAIPGSLPSGYATLKAAIADLNSYGVTGSGVTFNIAAGYTETFTLPADGLISTTSGTSASPIVFQKSGIGANPVISAAPGTGTMDAIIAIAGCDNVTFDGINLAENAANTTTTAQMEWGYAILKSSGTDGSQNITIRNCTVSLAVAYTATIGIYSNNHTTSSITGLTVTASNGTNSNLKIYSNTLNNCYTGIYLNGFNDPNAPYTYYDQNNEIGKDGGNIITNVAGQATTTGYGIFAQYQNNLKVANNTITSTMGGSGIPYGIFLTTAKNASYDLYGNYVSMQFSGGTGTTAFYPIYCDMGASGTSNTTNIYNNTVTGCTNTKVTSGNTYMINLTNLGITTSVYGNSITNNVTGTSSVTSIGAIRYLYCQHNPTNNGPFDLHDNTVTGNSRVQSAAGGGSTQFIYTTGSATVNNIYNNTVSNNVVASNGGTYLLNAGVDIGVKNIYNNTFTNITKAEGTTYGLYVYNVTSGSGLGTVYHNIVSNIEGLTAGATIMGIYSTSSGGTTNYFNNMVSDLRSLAGTSTSSNLYGFYLSSGTAGFYYNSVYLNGSSTGTNFGSAAAFVSSSSAFLDLRNNILVNTSVAKGTGKTIALRFNFTTFGTLLMTSNNNDLYAGTPGSSNMIFYNGTNGDITLGDYKVRAAPRDAQSVTEMPPFVSTTLGSCNLHLQTSVPTQCEAGGFAVSSPIAINTDWDGDARFPNAGYPVNVSSTPNAPDIGADEIGGLANDITGPALTYTPLGNINHTNNRTLLVTITDGTGIQATGIGRPTLYWSVNGGAYQSVQGSLVTGGTFTFSFGGGTSLGDIITYYVAAQDIVSPPNVSVFPASGAGGFTSSPPACSTIPSTPSSYTILQNLSGEYHVGVGKTYPTLTAAINDVNAKYIGGPVTLLLDDVTYPGETYPIIINSNPGSSPTNTLTIRPNAGNTATFSVLITTGLFNLNGIDYLIIDGSNNGTNSKNLTIENQNYTATCYAISIANNGGNDPTTNVTIKNCIIKTTLQGAGINGGIVVKFIGTFGGYDNIILDHNNIYAGNTGIQAYGVATGLIHNLQITNNNIGSMLDDFGIISTDINLQYADNTLISNNEIMGRLSGVDLPSPPIGIYLSSLATNTKIRNNKIHDIFHNTDDGWGACGIWSTTADNSTVTEISNNLIYDIKSYGINPGVGQNIVYGMFFRNGGNVKILHNSINLTGAYLSSTYEASSACLGFYYQTTGGNFEVRNNILRNSMTYSATPLTLGKAYGIMISLNPSVMFSALNNNDYYIDGYNGQIAEQYTNGTGAIVEFPTLASWQAYCGQEANSLNVNPTFQSNTNLMPTTVAMPHAGSYIPLVPTDYAGVNRTNPPDIGAYEFTSNPVLTTVAASGINLTAATLNGSANATGTTFNLYFDWGLTSDYGTTATAAPASVTGSVPTTISADLTGLTPGTTYHFRARGVTSDGLIVYGSDKTLTTESNKTLTITPVYLEGLYAGEGTLNQSFDDMGPHFAADTADLVTVELHNSGDYSVLEYSTTAAIRTTGSITTTIPYYKSGSYYVTIKHRSSIETTTAAPVSFSATGVNYSFSTQSQAYGDNMGLMIDGYPVIYAGDENQDGIIDSGDLSDIFNLANVAQSGYLPQDLNGDGLIDSSDLSMCFNNANQAIGLATP